MPIKQHIDDYDFHNGSVMNQLKTAMVYLTTLRQIAVDTDNEEFIDEIGKSLEEITQKLEEEYDRLKDIADSETTEEDRQREAHLNLIKKVYYEETGQPLLLTDKDIMNNMREDMRRISASLQTYNSPVPDWNGFVNNNKKEWVDSMKEKLERIKQNSKSFSGNK